MSESPRCSAVSPSILRSLVRFRAPEISFRGAVFVCPQPPNGPAADNRSQRKWLVLCHTQLPGLWGGRGTCIYVFGSSVAPDSCAASPDLGFGAESQTFLLATTNFPVPFVLAQPTFRFPRLRKFLDPYRHLRPGLQARSATSDMKSMSFFAPVLLPRRRQVQLVPTMRRSVLSPRRPLPRSVRTFCR